MKNHRSRPLTKDEYESILSYCRMKFNVNKNPYRKFVHLRNLCLYSFMWNIGSRPSEALKIRLKDINLKDNIVFIDGKNNKTKKSRHRKISTPLKEILIEYLLQLYKICPETTFLFPTKSRESVSRRTIQYSFEKVLIKLDLLEISFIDKNNTPRYTLNLYSFRKGHGTYLYEKTGDVYIVQKSLDHEDVATTIKFYIRTIPDKINEKILCVFNT